MTQQGSGDGSGPDPRTVRRVRVLIWLAAALVVFAWGANVYGPLEKGYKDSGDVLDRRERVEMLAREKENLTDEVAHADTDEGRDEQVKIMFGAGPPKDVLLDVHVETSTPEEPPVVGLFEITQRGISARTGAFLKSWRRIRDVWECWAGQDPAQPTTIDESSNADQL